MPTAEAEASCTRRSFYALYSSKFQLVSCCCLLLGDYKLQWRHLFHILCAHAPGWLDQSSIRPVRCRVGKSLTGHQTYSSSESSSLNLDCARLQPPQPLPALRLCSCSIDRQALLSCPLSFHWQPHDNRSTTDAATAWSIPAGVRFRLLIHH
jgi:hypothetical protein